MHRHVRQNAAADLGAAMNAVKVRQVLRSRIAVMVSENKALDAIEPRQRGERAIAEKDVAKVPHRIVLSHGVVPAPNQLVVMLLDSGERTMIGFELDDLLVPEMRVGNDENSVSHLSLSLKDVCAR